MATEPQNVEEAIRVVDNDRSAKETRQGEAIAKHAGVSVEELDRRMHADDNRRDAQGLPPLSPAQLAERVKVDDFGKVEDPERTIANDPLPGPTATKGKKDLSTGEVVPEHADQDVVLQREASEQRRLQAQAAVQERYIQESGKYFSRDTGNRLAFEDAGTKLKTRESDAYTASSMAMMAEAKGWTSIKVTGDPEFKRAVWMESQLRGIQVKGYTPTDVDKAALADRQAKQARNLVEPLPERTKGGPVDPARKIMEQAAAAVVGAKVKDPAVRDQVMNVVRKQLDGREAAKQPIPPVKVYDSKAAPQKQLEPSLHRDRKAERSR